MGFFGSGTQYTAAVVLSKIFDSDDTPTTLKQAVVTSILTDGDLTDYLLMAQLKNFSTKVHKYFRYGESTFYLRLPTADTGMIGVEPEQIEYVLMQDQLDKDPNYPNTIVSVTQYLALPDINVIAMDFLQTKYGWNESTNLFHPFPNDPFPAERDKEYVLRNVSYRLDYTTQINYIDLEYEWVNPPLCLQDPCPPTEITESIVNTLPNTLHYHAKVKVLPPAGQTLPDPMPYYWWIYDPATGKYPTLDLTPAIVDNEYQYLPIVPIRLNDVNIVDTAKGATQYITTDKIMSLVNMDLATITGNISENPDIEDINDVFFLFGLDLFSTIPEAANYYYEYFKHIMTISSVDKNSFDSAYARTKRLDTFNIFSIHEADLHIKVVYNYINEVIKSGVLPNDAKYNKSFSLHSDYIVDLIESAYDPYSYTRDPDGYTLNSSYILRKQISANTYSEITINALKLYYDIEYHDLKRTTMLPGITEGPIIIPIVKEIIYQFSGTSEEKILFDSAFLYINSQHKEKLSWYQKSFFKVLMIVVAVIIAAFTGQFEALQAALALAQAAGAMAMAILIAKGIVISLLVDYAVQWIMEHVGGIFGIILAAAVSYFAGQFAGGGNSGNVMSFSDKLLYAVTGVLNSVDAYFDSEMSKIQEEYKEFMEDAGAELEEIEALEALFDTRGDISNPMYTVGAGMYSNPTESPEAYYSRRTHSNPGVLALKWPERFVDIQLTLPEDTAALETY